MLMILAGLTMSACSSSTTEPSTIPATTSTSTSASTGPSTTPSAPEISVPVTIEAFDAGGVGGSGQTVSPHSLTEEVTYSFGDFVPGFTAMPPTPNWAAGLHDETAVLLEWTEENGQRP